MDEAEEAMKYCPYIHIPGEQCKRCGVMYDVENEKWVMPDITGYTPPDKEEDNNER